MKRAELLGRLTADPVTKQIGDKTLCTFSLADRSTVKGIEQTDYTDVKCWGERAAIAAQSFHKGNRVYVAGRLVYENYTDREGHQRRAVFVEAQILLYADGSEKGGEITDGSH